MSQLYGLTCGYWTSDPEDLDAHVIEHARAGKASELYDLMEEQAPDMPAMRVCGEGIG